MRNHPSTLTSIAGTTAGSRPAEPGHSPPAQASSPDSLSRCVAVSLSAEDLHLLAQIDDPDAPLNPAQYAAFLARPEIRAALDAKDEVLARRERTKERQYRDFVEAEVRRGVEHIHKVLAEIDAQNPAESPAKDDAAPGARHSELAPKDRIAETRRCATQLIRLGAIASSRRSFNLAQLRARAGSTQDSGPRTQDSGPRTQDAAPTQHSASPEASRRGDRSTKQASKPPPEPAAVPAPGMTPLRAFNKLLLVLRSIGCAEDPPKALATLAAHLAPGATCNGRPLPTDPAALIAEVSDDPRHPAAPLASLVMLPHDFMIDEHTFGAQVIRHMDYDGGGAFWITIRFGHTSSEWETNCWLIHSIELKRISDRVCSHPYSGRPDADTG